MIAIVKAKQEDYRILANVGKVSFIESHGHSAKEEDINQYVQEKFNEQAIQRQLADENNLFYIIKYGDQVAGYSKIIVNAPHPNIEEIITTKLERLYLLKEFINLQLGYALLKYNIEVSMQLKQESMWLFVWTENQRAIQFYTKMGFETIGSYDFKLTASHSNPNHQMYLKFGKSN